MSGRRAINNRIRGPQSALTDFLASNNISAAQIAADYARRQREAQEAAEAEATAQRTAAEPEQTFEQTLEQLETKAQKKRRKQLEEAALAKIKGSKAFKRQKKSHEGEPEGDDEDLAWDMYAKKAPLPGQLENCEICEKRFTVTPYSKTGPEGGLLCAKCSKEQEAQKKRDGKQKKQPGGRERRRQTQSNLLDGILEDGARPLLELCITTVADNIHDIHEFGDLPPSLLNRLSQILSKRRVINSRTLDLFLRPDLETVDIYDCGKLETEDYIKIFSVVPKVKNLNLRNAGQFKDEVIDYIIERNVPLKRLQLEAANLISNAKWVEFFENRGAGLESLKLAWLDYTMDDDVFMHLVRNCPNLRRLKMKKCFRLGDLSLGAIWELKHLEHLSLRFPLQTSSMALDNLIASIGSQLRTLSLENFYDADDKVLLTIRATCTQLTKLRFTENDLCTDAGFTSLFTDWPNPPLTFIDLSSNRSVDCSKPDGPVDDPTGLSAAGFIALMNHSGSLIEHLDISSCRHITYEAFLEVFDGQRQYPMLQKLNITFLTNVDTVIVAGIFKSCPQLTQLTAFGCFNVAGVVVPRGVGLVGVPNAQDSILQEG